VYRSNLHGPHVLPASGPSKSLYPVANTCIHSLWPCGSNTTFTLSLQYKIADFMHYLNLTLSRVTSKLQAIASLRAPS
jgi:hypothetical protein